MSTPQTRGVKRRNDFSSPSSKRSRTSTPKSSNPSTLKQLTLLPRIDPITRFEDLPAWFLKPLFEYLSATDLIHLWLLKNVNIIKILTSLDMIERLTLMSHECRKNNRLYFDFLRQLPSLKHVEIFNNTSESFDTKKEETIALVESLPSSVEYLEFNEKPISFTETVLHDWFHQKTVPKPFWNRFTIYPTPPSPHKLGALAPNSIPKTSQVLSPYTNSMHGLNKYDLLVFDFGSKFPNLKVLKMMKTPVDLGLEKISVHHDFKFPKSLESLHFRLYPEFAPQFWKLPESLTELTMIGSMNLETANYVVSRCVNLVYLHISISSVETPADVPDDLLAVPVSKTNAKKSKTLEFDATSKVKKLCIHLVETESPIYCNFPPLLEELTLILGPNSDQHPYKILKQIKETCLNLKRLIISGTFTVPPKFGESLPPSMTDLQLLADCKITSPELNVTFNALPRSLVSFGISYRFFSSAQMLKLPANLTRLNICKSRSFGSGGTFSKLPQTITEFNCPKHQFPSSEIDMIPLSMKYMAIGILNWEDTSIEKLITRFAAKLKFRLVGTITLTGKYCARDLKIVTPENLLEQFAEQMGLLINYKDSPTKIAYKEEPPAESSVFRQLQRFSSDKHPFLPLSEDPDFIRCMVTLITSPFIKDLPDLPPSITELKSSFYDRCHPLDYLSPRNLQKLVFISGHVFEPHFLEYLHQLPHLRDLSLHLANFTNLNFVPSTVKNLILRVVDPSSTSFDDLKPKFGLRSDTHSPYEICELLYSRPKSSPAQPRSFNWDPHDGLEMFVVNPDTHPKIKMERLPDSLSVLELPAMNLSDLPPLPTKLDLLSIGEINVKSKTNDNEIKIPSIMALKLRNLKSKHAVELIPDSLIELEIREVFDTSLLKLLPASVKTISAKNLVYDASILTLDPSKPKELSLNSLRQARSNKPLKTTPLFTDILSDILQEHRYQPGMFVERSNEPSADVWMFSPDSFSRIPEHVTTLDLTPSCTNDTEIKIGEKTTLNVTSIDRIPFSKLPHHITELVVTFTMTSKNITSLPPSITKFCYDVFDETKWHAGWSCLPKTITSFRTKCTITNGLFGWTSLIPDHLHEISIFTDNLWKGYQTTSMFEDLPPSVKIVHLPDLSLPDTSIKYFPKTVEKLYFKKLELGSDTFECLVIPSNIPNFSLHPIITVEQIITEKPITEARTEKPTKEEPTKEKPIQISRDDNQMRIDEYLYPHPKCFAPGYPKVLEISDLEKGDSKEFMRVDVKQNEETKNWPQIFVQSVAYNFHPNLQNQRTQKYY